MGTKEAAEAAPVGAVQRALLLATTKTAGEAPEEPDAPVMDWTVWATVRCCKTNKAFESVFEVLKSRLVSSGVPHMSTPKSQN